MQAHYLRRTTEVQVYIHPNTGEIQLALLHLLGFTCADARELVVGVNGNTNRPLLRE